MSSHSESEDDVSEASNVESHMGSDAEADKHDHPFEDMPKDPIIARDMPQALRMLAYGTGTRCAITSNFCFMAAIGDGDALKAFADAWFRFHRRVARFAVVRTETPGLAQMVISLGGVPTLTHDGEIIDMDGEYIDDSDDDGYIYDGDEDMGDFIGGQDEFLDDEEDDHDEDYSDEEDSDEDDDLSVSSLSPLYTGIDGTGEDEFLGGPRVCANCNSDLHGLRRCAGPLADDGPDIAGCPFHNTRAHGIDDCPYLTEYEPNDDVIRYFYSILVVSRSGKAPFRSTRLPWTKVARLADEWGLTPYPGPFPWTARFAEQWRERARHLNGRRPTCAIDPATADQDAVEETIAKGDGQVPDPGDLAPWLRPQV